MPEQTESPTDSAAPIARSYLAWALAATVLCFELARQRRG